MPAEARDLECERGSASGQWRIRVEAVTSCPLCGDARLTTVLRALDHDAGTGEYRLEQCAACGMRFTSPQPVPADVHLLYSERSFDALPGRGTPQGWLRAARTRARLRRLRKQLPPGSLRFADIGTGDGFFARQLADLPYCSSVVACDFFEQPPPALRGVPRARYVGYERFFESDEPFDVVFCRFVLEHVRDPVRFVADVRRLLRPGGVLIVDVPNWRALWRRVFGAYYSELSLPAHVNHFDPTTLRRLLRGFEVEILEDTHGLVVARSLGNVLGTTRARTGAFALTMAALEIAGSTLVGPPANMTAIARLPRAARP